MHDTLILPLSCVTHNSITTLGQLLLSHSTVSHRVISFCNVFVFTEDAEVFSWGRADYGQLGVGDDVVQRGFRSEPTEIAHIRGAKQVFK